MTNQDVAYQIKVGNMYVFEPKVEQIKVADPTRKFMGFRIGKAPKEKDEFKYLDTTFSDKPQSLYLPDDILNVIVNGLAEDHDEITVYQMVPHQIFPQPEEEEEVELLTIEAPKAKEGEQ